MMHRELLEAARAAAEAGAAVLRRYFRSADLEVRTKAQNDFVTQADHESEAVLVSELLRRFPDHRILAEEGSKNSSASGDYEWVIDPLDGTTNFLQGLPVWAISIACRKGNEILAGVVLDPEGGNLFTAARGGGAFWNGNRMRVSDRPELAGAFLATGYPFRAKAALDAYLAVFRGVFEEARAIRRCGAAALDLAYVAAGVYDGFFEFRLSPWDIAAGSLLIEQAGGVLSDLDGGGAYLETGNVLAGNPGVHAGLVAVAKRYASEEDIRRLLP
ncbi:MAG: inositol monophosphatase family protein [Thermoanaerobaculia bacterium]